MPTPARATRWSRVTQGSPSGLLGRKKGEVGVDTTPSSSSSILEINLEFPRCSSRRTAALLESGSNRRTTVTTVTTALSQVGRGTRNQT